jgi:hypothetical protein
MLRVTAPEVAKVSLLKFFEVLQVSRIASPGNSKIQGARPYSDTEFISITELVHPTIKAMKARRQGR